MVIQKQKTKIRVVSDLKSLDRKILYVRYVEDEHTKMLVGFDDAGNGYALVVDPTPPRPARKARKPRTPRR